tara:strand:- start:1507 stop:2220 length:714 start_codon:yes stop_codon:yes gene_type:complete
MGDENSDNNEIIMVVVDKEKPKEKPKKKRGRKPKKPVPNVENNTTKLSNNMVIKLNHINEETTTVLPFSDDTFFSNEGGGCGSLCWNCCHSFEEMVYGLPLKYISGIFYTYGDFCSLECAARYALEYFDNYHEIISLVNLYNNITNETTDKVISLAPNKLLLKTFGGTMEIDEYRGGFSDKNIHDIKIPPILPIKHTIDTHEINSGHNKANLKLYRKKPLPSEKKSITNSMNLMINL